MLVRPRASAVLRSSAHVNTLWLRLDSRFIAVSPTRRAACPRASSAETSPTARRQKGACISVRGPLCSKTTFNVIP